VQAGAKAASKWGVKLLQKTENEDATANSRKRRRRLDKLGVTGSSPVPPTPARSPLGFAEHDDFERFVFRPCRL
jgi:hypothetical protein